MDQDVLRVFTSFIKAVLENLLDGLLCGLEGVLPPGLPVVTAEDDDLSLAASQGGEVRHLDDDGAEELGSGRAQLQDSAGDGLTLHQWRGVDQFVLLEVPGNDQDVRQFPAGVRHSPAGDPHRHGSLPGRDDDPHPGVSAASHGPAPGVHHEADQEPATGGE